MRINYSESKRAPVVVCFVKYADTFLLLKRSDKVLAYKNLWSSLAGFLDDEKSVEEKVFEELREELGIMKENVRRVVIGDTYTFRDETLGKEWIRHLCIAEVTSPEIRLDWEHTDFRWIHPDEADQFATVPGLARDLQSVRSL